MLQRVFQRNNRQLLFATSLLRQYATQHKKTALYNFHVENGAKMVPYSGWMMPLTYKDDGIIKPHLWCRESCAFFDVSHMGQILIKGKDRYDFIESLVPGNIKDLKIGQSRLTQFTNEKGGILDDTIITRRENDLFEVVNAGCAEQDIKILEENAAQWRAKGKDVNIELFHSKNSQFAIQGPKTLQVLQRFVSEDLSSMKFMTCSELKVDGVPCLITRSGYTGEDGFEISVEHKHVEQIARKLLSQPEVKLAGLGSRDTLRLEAGLCLMGSDMSPDITPIEAGLTWTIGKRRRAEGGFPGADVILKQIKEGVSRKRIGFKMLGNGIARGHYKIFSKQGDEIGVVTSGTKTPCLEYPIGMGYVKTPYAEVGRDIVVEVRNKKFDAQIVSMPFVKRK